MCNTLVCVKVATAIEAKTSYKGSYGAVFFEGIFFCVFERKPKGGGVPYFETNLYMRYTKTHDTRSRTICKNGQWDPMGVWALPPFKPVSWLKWVTQLT